MGSIRWCQASSSRSSSTRRPPTREHRRFWQARNLFLCAADRPTTPGASSKHEPMNAASAQARLLAAARPRFRDLKYKLLGLPLAPQAARPQYAMPQTWTETDTLQYLKQTRVLARSAIALLARATDLNANLPTMPSIRAELKSPSALEQLFRANADFGQSLHQLTAYDYGARHTEQISNFLIHKLRPGNSLELSADGYNRAIGFFLNTNDIHMARLLWHQMQARRVPPDTATVNLFLASQARRVAASPYPSDQFGHPLLMIVSLLRKMGRLGIKASAETWNVVLQCMPFGFGKSFLVEEMDRRGIPLNAASLQVCLGTIITEHGFNRKGSSGVSPRIYEAVAGSLDLENPVVMRLVIERALLQKQPNNENVLVALELLRGTAPADNSVETLNVFLRHFAGRKHLDWQFGVLGDFPGAQWSSETWEYFIQGASTMFYSQEERYVIIGTVLKQAEREQAMLTPRARYYARRAVKEAVLRGRKLQDLGSDGWQSLKASLQWRPNTMQPHAPAYLSCIGFSSEAGPRLETMPAVLDQSRFEALPTTNSIARRRALDIALKQPSAGHKDEDQALSTFETIE